MAVVTSAPTLTFPPARPMHAIPIQELEDLYGKLLDAGERTPLFVWGPPGIGKSQLIHQAAAQRELPVIDVRLSQLTPSDIRGLPVADHEARQARFYPPEFLPASRQTRAVLFLDEFNQAPPVMQGIVQQLVLDRRVGDYVLPDGVFIVAAGNRRQDRAAVHELTAPVANRFLHVEVSPDLAAWRQFGTRAGVHEHILAFLGFRGAELLHRMSLHEPAWPSPRSWVMASRLHAGGLSVALAVGAACAAEFEAFLQIYQHLPDIDAILAGEPVPGASLPAEPSARWATVTALVMRARSAEQAIRAATWLHGAAGAEWLQRYFSDALPRLREQKMLADFAARVDKHKTLKRWLDHHAAHYA
jgi:MoxR-like ATPase